MIIYQEVALFFVLSDLVTYLLPSLKFFHFCFYCLIIVQVFTVDSISGSHGYTVNRENFVVKIFVCSINHEN